MFNSSAKLSLALSALDATCNPDHSKPTTDGLNGNGKSDRPERNCPLHAHAVQEDRADRQRPRRNSRTANLLRLPVSGILVCARAIILTFPLSWNLPPKTILPKICQKSGQSNPAAIYGTLGGATPITGQVSLALGSGSTSRSDGLMGRQVEKGQRGEQDHCGTVFSFRFGRNGFSKQVAEFGKTQRYPPFSPEKLLQLQKSPAVVSGTHLPCSVACRPRPPKSKSYISRVTTLVTTSAAAHTRLRLSQALRRIARPNLL